MTGGDDGELLPVVVERHPNARRDLGMTKTLAVRLHPDLMAWVKARAAADYCTDQDVIRRLVVEAMRTEREPK